MAQSFLAELDAYEEELDALVERRWDPDLYRQLSDRFDRMQLYAGSLPRLTMGWTELLISRVELSHAIWSIAAPARINGRVLGLHARHNVLIAEVRRHCKGYLGLDEVVNPGFRAR